MLVMVLVLLVVAAISLAGLARHTLETCAHAATEQADVNRRWGIFSCLQLYASSPESLLEAEAQQLPVANRIWPLPAAKAIEFNLGNLQFSVLVADEEAKLNLNAILSRAGGDTVLVMSLVEQVTGSAGLSVQLQPAVDEVTKREMNAFKGWGQVFEMNAADTPGQAACRLRDATREISCWGSGRLNIRRASDEAVRLMCGNQLTPDVVAKLLAVRQQPGINGLSDLLSRMQLRLSERSVLERLLTDRSSRYSVWIVARNEHRTWATLAIGRATRQSGSSLETFTW